MLARARSRKFYKLEPPRETPTIGNGACPRFSIQCSAGKIFLNARSPVAPNRTNASESGSAIAHPYKTRLAEDKAGQEGRQATIVAVRPTSCYADARSQAGFLEAAGPGPHLGLIIDGIS